MLFDVETGCNIMIPFAGLVTLVVRTALSVVGVVSLVILGPEQPRIPGTVEVGGAEPHSSALRRTAHTPQPRRQQGNEADHNWQPTGHFFGICKNLSAFPLEFSNGLHAHN